LPLISYETYIWLVYAIVPMDHYGCDYHSMFDGHVLLLISSETYIWLMYAIVPFNHSGLDHHLGYNGHVLLLNF
jgi:hypothetical protein